MTSTGSCHDVALCWLPVLLCVDCLTCFWTRSWLDLTCFWRSRGQFGQWVILARILLFCQGWSSNCLLNYLTASFSTQCGCHLFALAGGISVNSDTAWRFISLWDLDCENTDTPMTIQRSSRCPINLNSLFGISLSSREWFRYRI